MTRRSPLEPTRPAARKDFRFAVGLLLAACLFATPASAATITLLDGSVVKADIQSIDERGQVTVGDAIGVPDTLDLYNMRRIDLVEPGSKKATPPKLQSADTADPLTGPYLLRLADGGHTYLNTFSVADGNLSLRYAPDGKPDKMPIDRVRAVRLRSVEATKFEKQGAMFDRALADKSLTKDRLFVITKTGIRAIDGVVEAVTDKELSFIWQDTPRKLPLQRVYGFVLAMTGKPPDNLGKVAIHTVEGWLLWGRLQSLKDNTFTLAYDDGRTTDIQWSRVLHIDVRSDRLVHLSDLDPVQVEQSAIVTQALPWQRDRGVTGQPMKIGDVAFSRGLGVHAHNELVFDIGARFDTFAVTIGIDAATGGKGDCVFIVEADGRELHRQRVKGADKPRNLQLKITGVRRLTLRVETGEDLDLADHANWAEARLIKAVKP